VPALAGQDFRAQLAPEHLGVHVALDRDPLDDLRESKRLVVASLRVDGVSQTRCQAREMAQVADAVEDLVAGAELRLRHQRVAREHLDEPRRPEHSRTADLIAEFAC
jgi:hypothetical protein